MKVFIDDLDKENIISEAIDYISSQFNQFERNLSVRDLFVSKDFYYEVCILLIGILFISINNGLFFWFGLLFCIRFCFVFFNRIAWVYWPKNIVQGKITNIQWSNLSGCPNNDEIKLKIYYTDNTVVQECMYYLDCPYRGIFIGDIVLEDNDIIKGADRQWVLPISVSVVFLKNMPTKLRLAGIQTMKLMIKKD